MSCVVVLWMKSELKVHGQGISGQDLRGESTMLTCVNVSVEFIAITQT